MYLSYLNVLGFVNTAVLAKLRTKIISYFIVIVIELLGKKITSDIVLKYPSFNLLNDTEKTVFLFNNSDSFVCKKLGYFVYEALNIRETFNLI